MSRLFVVSGPSGVGKRTVIKKVLEARPSFKLPISHTTRAPRPDEIDGVDYHFVTIDIFSGMLARDEFAESVQFPPGVGNLYGTSKAELSGNGDVLIEIEVQGARQMKAQRPDATLIFLTASVERIRGRLTRRGDVKEGETADRLARAEEELREGPSLYDHVVSNDGDGLDKAVEAILAIIDAQERPR